MVLVGVGRLVAEQVRSRGEGCSVGRGGVAVGRGLVLLSGMWGWVDAVLWRWLAVTVSRC
jgi:hypothetical protein